MSVQEIVSGSALRMCTSILLCREEFGHKESEVSYSFLENLLGDVQTTGACKKLLEFDFHFERYNLASDVLQPCQENVVVPRVIQEWKLNRETEDYCSLLLKKIAGRIRGNCLNRRVFSAVTALLNSREFVEHLDAETEGCVAIGSSRILDIARDFHGPCFTDSFDKRTYYLPAAAQAARKKSRLLKIIERELSREDFDLKGQGWRKKYCIENKTAYGSLLGKNAGAILTFTVGVGGTTSLPCGQCYSQGHKSRIQFNSALLFALSGRTQQVSKQSRHKYRQNLENARRRRTRTRYNTAEKYSIE
jgi:hypothetical protein